MATLKAEEISNNVLLVESEFTSTTTDGVTEGSWSAKVQPVVWSFELSQWVPFGGPVDIEVIIPEAALDTWQDQFYTPTLEPTTGSDYNIPDESE